MEKTIRPLLILLLFAFFSDISVEVSATTVTIFNKCPYIVWPGIVANPGKSLLARGGFKLPPNKSYTLDMPPLWSGRIWGRHDCAFDRSGRGGCATGDCGGNLLCDGFSGAPPVTLAEFAFRNDQDFYDVSIVDGYNIAMAITPDQGSGSCNHVGCVSDVNLMCPSGLQVRSHDNRQVVACKSPCFTFNSPRYCCTGNYSIPEACKLTAYSNIFRVACPNAYLYAYDDDIATATCTRANYLVTFCPQNR